MNVFEDDFETWNSEGSPSRTPEYILGDHNPLEPRMSSERNYGPKRLRHQFCIERFLSKDSISENSGNKEIGTILF